MSDGHACNIIFRLSLVVKTKFLRRYKKDDMTFSRMYLYKNELGEFLIIWLSSIFVTLRCKAKLLYM